MFSLIIIIGSIALVVAVVASTLYHGGDTIKAGSQHAAAVRLLSEGAQVHSALVFHQAQFGQHATTIAELVESNTLATAVPGWDIIDGYAYRTVDTRVVCLAANEKVGVHSVPSCADPIYASTALCCSQES